MKIIFTTFLFILFASLVPASGKADSLYNGKNIVKLSPISLFDDGIGVGLSYERFFDKKQRFSFIVPIDYLFSNFNNTNGYNNYSVFYVSPGLKFYPGSAKRAISYAVGPSLMFGTGRGVSWTSSYYYGEENVTTRKFGVLVVNYLEVMITQKLNIGLSAALGLRYVDNYYNDYGLKTDYSYEDEIMPIGQFRFTLGYKF